MSLGGKLPPADVVLDAPKDSFVYLVVYLRTEPEVRSRQLRHPCLAASHHESGVWLCHI